MAIPEGKERITITIHKETKELMNELLSLHDNLSYSTLVEVALYIYAKMIDSGMNQEGDKENGKN